MINTLRNSTFLKTLWGLLGLFLLNISVDSTDLVPKHVSEDLSINDQESIVEIIIEKILGLENFVSEYDDVDSDERDSQNNHISLKVFFVDENQPASSMNIVDNKIISGNSKSLTPGFYRLLTPPPKA